MKVAAMYLGLFMGQKITSIIGENMLLNFEFEFIRLKIAVNNQKIVN